MTETRKHGAQPQTANAMDHLVNEVGMRDAKHSNPVGHLHGSATTRTVVASNHVMALWRTVIGKKVVMALMGAPAG